MDPQLPEPEPLVSLIEACGACPACAFGHGT